MKRYGLTACLLLACMVLLSGCASYRTPAEQNGQVADLARLPQNLSVYAGAAGAHTSLLAPQRASAKTQQFAKLFFAPWHSVKPSIGKQAAFGELGPKARGYAENLLPWTQSDWDAMRQNSLPETYPSLFLPAISVRITSLRAVPTHRPRFVHPEQAGQGYPFDMFQYASLPPGMPLLVLHASQDKAWVFVENALVGGWLPAEDVAYADTAFIQAWQTTPLQAALKDNSTLYSGQGVYWGKANIGTLLPLAGTGTEQGLKLPYRQPDGTAAYLVSTGLEGWQAFPLKLTPEALAGLGNHMLGQAYGWGGMYANRDCSAMLRDLFVPFGIWLPRNSAAQAKAWTFTDLSALSVPEREQHIQQHGKAFATLLWLPGHIALYLGVHDGKAVMLHDVWGLRTVQDGREGRHILGRVVISTTQPGAELSNIQDATSLLGRMQGMAVLE